VHDRLPTPSASASRGIGAGVWCRDARGVEVQVPWGWLRICLGGVEVQVAGGRFWRSGGGSKGFRGVKIHKILNIKSGWRRWAKNDCRRRLLNSGLDIFRCKISILGRALVGEMAPFSAADSALDPLVAWLGWGWRSICRLAKNIQACGSSEPWNVPSNLRRVAVLHCDSFLRPFLANAIAKLVQKPVRTPSIAIGDRSISRCPRLLGLDRGCGVRPSGCCLLCGVSSHQCRFCGGGGSDLWRVWGGGGGGGGCGLHHDGCGCRGRGAWGRGGGFSRYALVLVWGWCALILHCWRSRLNFRLACLGRGERGRGRMAGSAFRIRRLSGASRRWERILRW